MRRRHWIVVLALPLALVAADIAYWRFMTERLRSGYQSWVAARVAEGWEIGAGPLSVGGWPRSATIGVPNLTVRHPASTVPGALDMASAGIQLSISLFNPLELRLSPLGPTHVRAADSPDIIVTADDAVLSVPLRQMDRMPADLHVSGLRVEQATGAWHTTVGLLNARVEVATTARADAAEPDGVFAISTEAIALPAGIKWPLGSNISSLSFDGRFNGPVPKSQPVTRWAEAWRDGGGSLEITHLALGWGPLGLTSSATLALDDQLQPMGSGNGRVVGYAATLDRLAAGGLLTKSAATAAKAVLSLMAGTADADEPSSVDVPLTLQYRTLSMRQVPLVRLPELDWPER